MIDFLLNPWTIFGAGLSVTAIFAAVWFLLPGMIPALLASRLGRRIAVIAAAVFAVWLLLVRVFSAGRAKEREVVTQNNERRERQTEHRENELKKTPAGDLPERASKWVRD